MAIPITGTQTADNSILDINGRQTYLGNSFSLPATGTSLTDTSEHPMMVIKNATGSGKSLFIPWMSLLSNNNPVIVRFYLAPVLNVPGSTTTPVNLRTGSGLVSVATCYLGATITSNGTLFFEMPVTTTGLVTNLLSILDPGAMMLATGQQAAGGTSLVVVNAAWYEI